MHIGFATDHGGYILREPILKALRDSGHEVRDFGAYSLNHRDDYHDFVIPLARAVAHLEVERGIAICGSGVGASFTANKIPGVRSALIHESYSAHQGVEDDDMNLLCLGGRVVGSALAWEIVRTFLDTRYGKAERFERRLAKELVDRKEPVDRQVFDLGKYHKAFYEQIASLETAHFSSRLWRKDASLWKEDPKDQEYIRNALGWLHVAEKMEENLGEINAFKDEILKSGFRHVLHMGMGGSSLTPLVFARTFSQHEHALPLTVLDTTDPATILSIERTLAIENTLFIVASKSGTTAEPLAFGEYFYQKVKKIKEERAGENFCVITDPGTPLVKLAQERSYRKTFLNFADIGGRYSALSYFGLVPAALMGVDVSEILARALRMVYACTSSIPAAENPGLMLGAALGVLAKNNQRNKVTFLVPEAISSLGMWLEQLLAESTGKEGTGLPPVAGEPVGKPEEYGADRVFVYIRMKDTADENLENSATALREAGSPVITISVDDLLDLGQEFFRWEIATATAGSILGINAFNQPNVQESKDNTNRLLAMVGSQGKLPQEEPSLIEAPLKLYFEKTASTVATTLEQFLAERNPGDYLALMAYISENPPNSKGLQNLRRRLQERLRIPTTMGYGPRFLHSTGQFHKGGPNTGLFLQLTVDDVEDVPIPGAPYTFGVFKQAQALGDLEALRKHSRRVGRIHLGPDANQGLIALEKALKAAIK